MWENTEIGTAHRRIRIGYLGFTDAPVSTVSFVLV